MKIQSILILLILSNISYGADFRVVDNLERGRLNTEFSLSVRPIMARFVDGDVVGNGGGLLEQNFLHAYFSLQTAIENCLTDVECYTSETQKNTLIQINQIFINKSGLKTPLVFIKNSETNNFFFDENDQTERIAKTGYSEDFPIFINLDVASSIVNDIPAMLGVIVHELGHQLGILNHNYLDQLGAKVRSMWNANWIISSVQIGGEELSLRLFSSKSSYINSRLSYVYNGKVKTLNSLIYKKTECTDGGRVYGISLSNGYWQRPVESEFVSTVRKTYWIDIYCENEDANGYFIKQDLDLSFTFNNSIGKAPVLFSVEASIR